MGVTVSEGFVAKNPCGHLSGICDAGGCLTAAPISDYG